MFESLTFSGFFQVVVTILVLFFPYFAVSKNKEGIKGKEFIKRFPQFKWIRRCYVPLYVLWIIFILSIQFLVVVNNSPIEWFFSVGTTYTLIGGFYGFFALVTDVLVIPYGLYQNFYTGSKAFQVAKTHVLICMVAIIVNSIIQFILTR